MTGILLRSRDQDTNVYRRKDREVVARRQPPAGQEKASEETNLVGTLISDF